LTLDGKTYDATADVTHTLTFSGYIPVGGLSGAGENPQPSGNYSLAIGYGTLDANGKGAVDAGTYYVNAVITVFTNSDLDKNFAFAQNLSSTSASQYTVAKAPITFVVTALLGKPYDGKTDVVSGGYSTAFVGYFNKSGQTSVQPTAEQFSVQNARYSSKDAGDRYILVDLSVENGSDLDTNFDFARANIQSGTAVSITKLTLTASVRYTPVTKMYDGTKKADGTPLVTFVGFISGEGFVENVDFKVEALYDDFAALSTSMTVRVYFTVIRDDISKNYIWNDDTTFPTFSAAMTKRPIGADIYINPREYDGTTTISKDDYTLSFTGLVPHYSENNSEGYTLVENRDYTIGELRYFTASAGTDKLAYANFKLLEAFPYYKFYSVEDEYMDTSIVRKGNILKKNITEAFTVEDSIYGTSFAAKVTAVGAKDEIPTGKLDFSSIANLWQAIHNGDYPVGEYTLYNIKLDFDAKWDNNYTSENGGVTVKITVVPRPVYLEIGEQGEAIVYDGADYTRALDYLAKVTTGVNDGVKFENYLKVKSVLRGNAVLIEKYGKEAINNAIFADTYCVSYYIDEDDLKNALKNYEFKNEVTGTLTIKTKTIDINEFGFERAENKLTVSGTEGYEIHFILQDSGRELAQAVGITEFDVNPYRAYEISAVTDGDDAFRYTVVGTVESKETANFFEAVAANVGETAGAGVFGYGIYFLVTALKKAKKAQASFETMKRASDARRLAAYSSEVKRIQGTKETSTRVQRQGVGTKAAPQTVVKKPKYPTYPDRIDIDVVPKTVPKGYSPVLKNQTIPKGKIKK
jgi:hypothetical protein